MKLYVPVQPNVRGFIEQHGDRQSPPNPRDWREATPAEHRIWFFTHPRFSLVDTVIAGVIAWVLMQLLHLVAG